MVHSDSPINVLEVVRVSPSSDSADSLNLPLTFFDLCWLKLHPVDRVIFYRLAESTRSFFDTVILPKLTSSLSITLSHYLPLAGRIAWDISELKPSIIWSRGDAVSLTVAESDADICGLSGDNPRVATELHPLVPELPVSDDSSPVVSFQITLFPNQGFCIGLSAHHAVLDGKTTAMFLKAWAHVCKREREGEYNGSFSLPYDLTPIVVRTMIGDPTGIETKLLNRWLSASNNKRSLKFLPSAEISPDVFRVTYVLTRKNIQKLRERVENESSQALQLHLSTFVITYAYILTCMVKARGGDANRRVSFGFAADFRPRLDPPVPATYFGNCVVGTGDFNARAGAFLQEEKGFVAAVERLSGLVKGLGPEMMEERILAPFEAFKNMEPGTQMVSVAGSTRLGIYGSDFGWGRPAKVEIVSIDKDAAVALAESRDGTGGVEIGVCMKKHDVQVFGSIFSRGLN